MSPVLKRSILLAEASDKTFLVGAALAAAIAEKTTVATSFTKVKEQKVFVPGTYRVLFTLRKAVSNSGSNSIRAQVYRNGVGVGVPRALASGGDTTAYTTYAQDIPGWTFGDLCQIYAFVAAGDGTDAAGVSAFLLQAEFAPRMSTFPLGGSVNA